MLAGTAVGGDDAFGARLASSLAGAASCLLAWVLAGKMFGPKVGRLAALVLATAPIVVANSKLATTDATLALLVLACQAALWRLSVSESTLAAATFWACLGLATLTKGPVALALIAASGLASWGMGGPTACWRRLRWRWGVPLALLIAAPWYVAIGVVTRGEFFRVAVGSQILHRVATGMEQHGGFPGYYPVTSLLAFYPWSALLPAALVAAIARRRGNPALGFALGWAVGPMVFLECVRTKLVHYYLPAYPACAMLVAWLVVAVAQSERSLWRWPLGRLGHGVLVGVGVTVVVAALAGVVVAPWLVRLPCLALAIVVGAGTALAAEALRSGRTERGALTLAGTWAASLLIVGAWLFPAVEPYRFSRKVAAELKRVAEKDNAVPLLATFQEPSLVYALGAPTYIMRDRTWLDGVLDGDGAAVAAMTSGERDVFLADPRFSVASEGMIRGFNLSKGRSESLELIVVRKAPPPERLASRTPALAATLTPWLA